MGWGERCEEAMKSLGYVKLEANWDGGGDEGGINSVDAWDEEGSKHPVSSAYTYAYVMMPMQGIERSVPYHRLITREEGLQDKIWDAISNALTDEYGGFAGEYHAYGTFAVDLSKTDPEERYVFEDSGAILDENTYEDSQW